MIEILNIIISPLAGLIGIFIGSYLSKQSTFKLQKDFYARQIRIEKYQELSFNMYEYLRKLGRMHANVLKYSNKLIDHNTFKKLNDDIQDEATDIHRLIVANIVFYSELEKPINEFFNSFFVVCDKIYDGFHYPDNPQPIYPKEEATGEKVSEATNVCFNAGDAIIKQINKKIDEELKDLSR